MLSIRDNGRGFDPEQALKREYGREHFGLWGMQERARSLGGAVEINSQPGEGASVIVDIPI
jgi:signal transduction histidine kinase